MSPWNSIRPVCKEVRSRAASHTRISTGRRPRRRRIVRAGAICSAISCALFLGLPLGSLHGNCRKWTGYSAGYGSNSAEAATSATSASGASGASNLSDDASPPRDGGGSAAGPHADSAGSQAENNAFRRSIKSQGISIEASISPLEPRTRTPGKLLEAENVLFQLKLTDEVTGSALQGARPAAWIDARKENEPAESRDCSKKISSYLTASILDAQPIDLNTYYVLTLNADSTISVVDPRFGYGGTKLLAMIALDSPGDDWVLSGSGERLFVSLPDSNKVAVADTASWKVRSRIDVGPRPARLLLQPDEEYLWVAYGTSAGNPEESGVAAISTSKLRVVARIPTGRGNHEIAISNDNAFVFVTNRDDGTLSIIDIRKLKKVKDVSTGKGPVSVAFSKMARMAYVTNERDGTVTIVGGEKLEILARIQAEPGVSQLKFAPGDRYGMLLSPGTNRVHVLDAASNRIIQTADIQGTPDQLAFSDTLAYVRCSNSETVYMIPLAQIGKGGRSLSVADFPGGQHVFGNVSRASLAGGIVQAPGENAVLVANPADKSIYYYAEGMAAPMGNFSNYGREPRAVLVVDRSLKERTAGVYSTVARLRGPGVYDVAILISAPRVAYCFGLRVDPDPELADQRRGRLPKIELVSRNPPALAGSPLKIEFKVSDPNNGRSLTGLKDLHVLAVLAPGLWQTHEIARQNGEGIYSIDLVPPKPGVYYLYLSAHSLGLEFSNSYYITLDVKDPQAASK